MVLELHGLCQAENRASPVPELYGLDFLYGLENIGCFFFASMR